MQTKETIEIENMVKKLMDAFAQADPATFTSVFHDDGDCIIRDGQYLKGKQEIFETHRRIFSTIYQEGTTSEYQIESIRFLQPTVVLVRIKGHMEFSQGTQVAEVNGRISLVCMNDEGKGWSVVLFQNTSVVKPL